VASGSWFFHFLLMETDLVCDLFLLCLLGVVVVELLSLD
jgi:hypothetical protein